MNTSGLYLYFVILFFTANSSICYSQDINKEKNYRDIQLLKDEIQQALNIEAQSSGDSVMLGKKFLDISERLHRYCKFLAADKHKKLECVNHEYVVISDQLSNKSNVYIAESKTHHADFAFEMMINSASKTVRSLNRIISCLADTIGNNIAYRNEDKGVTDIPYTFTPETKPEKLHIEQTTKELIQIEQKRIINVMQKVSSNAKIVADEKTMAAREAYERELPLRTWTEIFNSLDKNNRPSQGDLPQPRTHEEEQALAMMYVVMLAALPAVFQVDASALKGEVSFGWQTLFSINNIKPFSSDNSLMGVNIRYRKMFALSNHAESSRPELEIDIPLFLSWMPYDSSIYSYQTDFYRLYQIDPTIRYWLGRIGCFINSTFYGLEDSELFNSNRIGASLLIGSYDYTRKAYGILNIGYGVEADRWKSGWEADVDIAINNLLLSFSYNINQGMLQFCYRIRIPW